MTPLTAQISIEEYLKTSYRPDCDFVDGAVEERNLGEYDHGRIQHLLSLYIGNREDVWHVRVITEVRLRVSPGRVRIPDICVVLDTHLTEQVLVTPPFLCIEISSLEDRWSAMRERVKDYLDFSVPYVWLIESRERKCHIATRDEIQEAKANLLQTANPDIEVPMEEIFRKAALA